MSLGFIEKAHNRRTGGVIRVRFGRLRNRNSSYPQLFRRQGEDSFSGRDGAGNGRVWRIQ